LFGKAHTVMAEGGIAASMGNVNSKDSWQVHFRYTMRGGKFLNNPPKFRCEMRPSGVRSNRAP